MTELLTLFLRICELQTSKVQCFDKAVTCIEKHMGKKSVDDIILQCTKEVKE